MGFSHGVEVSCQPVREVRVWGLGPGVKGLGFRVSTSPTPY